jgi:leucyl aminopeptidase (aminopeptidase T)
MLWHSRIGAAAVGWIALTHMAVAQSGPSYQEAPTGDVWITPNQPNSFRHRATGRETSGKTEMPTGDVWLAPDDTARIAQPKAHLQQDATETDYPNNGSVK